MTLLASPQRKSPPPQAHRNKPHAEAQQGRKHGQAAIVHEESAEDDGDFIEHAVIEDAAEIRARPVLSDDPRGGHIRYRDA